jgi:hypothetical protein
MRLYKKGSKVLHHKVRKRKKSWNHLLLLCLLACCYFYVYIYFFIILIIDAYSREVGKRYNNNNKGTRTVTQKKCCFLARMLMFHIRFYSLSLLFLALLCVYDIIKLPFLLPCDDVLFECIVQKKNTESNKKVPRESKNAGSIYNVSNSVRKCHKKWQGWEDSDLKGDNWVSCSKWKWLLILYKLHSRF